MLFVLQCMERISELLTCQEASRMNMRERNMKSSPIEKLKEKTSSKWLKKIMMNSGIEYVTMTRAIARLATQERSHYLQMTPEIM